MTIYGCDISEHQNGLSLRQAKAEGIQFVILRLCDGTYRDKVFRSHLADAEQNGLLVSTYWYLRAPSEGTTIAQQVDVIDQQLGGRKDLGVWIDVESVRGSQKLLSGADVWEAKRELERRGYHVAGTYSGRWYFENMPGGEPSMDGLGYLWVSNYGANNRGTPDQIYPGDTSSRWLYPLGNRKPDLLQFGSNGQVAGFTAVDVNAWRGTLDELRAVFNGTGGEPVKKPEPSSVPVAPASEIVLDYPRDQVKQDTNYWCGPASAQTVIRSHTGQLVDERTLAGEMGTTVGGTNHIGLVRDVLNRRLPGANYAVAWLPNDPPSAEQGEAVWNNITSSIRAGFGVVANIVAPPNNYPRGVNGSVSPRYAGGTVYHYIAVMGFGGTGDNRRYWVADSGFTPYGYWISHAQLASLIPPKGYTFSTNTPSTSAPDTHSEVSVDNARLALDQLVGPERNDDGTPKFSGWAQLGGRTVVDYLVAQTGEIAALKQGMDKLLESNAELTRQLKNLGGK